MLEPTLARPFTGAPPIGIFAMPDNLAAFGLSAVLGRCGDELVILVDSSLNETDREEAIADLLEAMP